MSSFKKYYSDPEFRERHLNYMKEKVICDCGFMTSRNNMTRHKRSRNHTNRINKIENLKIKMI